MRFGLAFRFFVGTAVAFHYAADVAGELAFVIIVNLRDRHRRA